jgi:hypothetical protein
MELNVWDKRQERLNSGPARSSRAANLDGTVPGWRVAWLRWTSEGHSRGDRLQAGSLRGPV